MKKKWEEGIRNQGPGIRIKAEYREMRDELSAQYQCTNIPTCTADCGLKTVPNLRFEDPRNSKTPFWC